MFETPLPVKFLGTHLPLSEAVGRLHRAFPDRDVGAIQRDLWSALAEGRIPARETRAHRKPLTSLKTHLDPRLFTSRNVDDIAHAIRTSEVADRQGEETILRKVIVLSKEVDAAFNVDTAARSAELVRLMAGHNTKRLRIRKGEHEIVLDGRTIRLSLRSWRLLTLLAEAALREESVPIAQLRSVGRFHPRQSDNVFYDSIHKLRRALQPGSTDADWIVQNDYGSGYRLTIRPEQIQFVD